MMMMMMMIYAVALDAS